ncbi:hypothetical protein MCOR04_008918 [Pyricularia oryzae]|nr:hypothetical protein MCOR04_008918 [Pyricularia oryzae]
MWDYEIDPSGDTTLILRKPNAPFAAESSSAVANSSALPNKLKSEKKAARKAAKKEKKARRLNKQVGVLAWDVGEPSVDVELEPAITSATAEDGSFGTAETLKRPHLANSQPENARELDNSTHQKELRFRLSSKHMILASPYFKTMLGGPWREADELELEAEDWDREALLIIMRVIHVQNQHVPRLIKLELLAKIAVLVDYYECRDAIDLAAEIWIKQLTPPEEPSKDLVFLLLISWVFRRTTGQRRAVSLVTYCKYRHALRPSNVMPFSPGTSLPKCFNTSCRNLWYKAGSRARLLMSDAVVSRPANSTPRTWSLSSTGSEELSTRALRNM